MIWGTIILWAFQCCLSKVTWKKWAEGSFQKKPPLLGAIWSTRWPESNFQSNNTWVTEKDPTRSSWDHLNMPQKNTKRLRNLKTGHSHPGTTKMTRAHPNCFFLRHLAQLASNGHRHPGGCAIVHLETWCSGSHPSWAGGVRVAHFGGYVRCLF